MIRKMVKLAILASLLAVALATDQLPFETVYEWNYMNFTWRSVEEYQKAYEGGEYDPSKIPAIGVKIWKDKLYLTTPRLENGNPVALSVTSVTPQDGVTDPLMEPYPSWEMQTKGDCSAFQFVQSMEIDPLGRMWIIDTGRTATNTNNLSTKCPPRLVILDLENNGEVLRSYEFPEEVAPRDTVLLNDIVLDSENGGWAYISNSESWRPSLIVYSLRDNVAWKVYDNASQRADSDAVNFVVAGTNVSSSGGINGIALTPLGSPKRLFYYSPLASFQVYSVETSVLQDPSITSIAEYVSLLGTRSSQSGGMAMSNKGVLYYGIYNDDGIAVWNSRNSKSFTHDSMEVFTDHVRSQWPDTFAFDEYGRLCYISNRLQRFTAGITDITEPNYRILCAKVGAKSSQYPPDGTIPELPQITSDFE